ncbi:MAG: prolyl-tRNA synthetase associated domain-containing protein [Candidatus Latescibacterota bacterium]
MADVYAFLAAHDIAYQRADHAPVWTWEEAEEVVPDLPGVHTKNLFLRNRRGQRHFLLVVEGSAQVDLRALAEALGVGRLTLASAERLRQYLGLEPGAVSLLGVLNDGQRRVEVVVDRRVWQAEWVQCHPLVNTATLALRQRDLARLLEVTGHVCHVLDVPTRQT